MPPTTKETGGCFDGSGVRSAERRASTEVRKVPDEVIIEAVFWDHRLVSVKRRDRSR
jgi:hypothetical protein